jgi:hypothetical protein
MAVEDSSCKPSKTEHGQSTSWSDMLQQLG